MTREEFNARFPRWEHLTFDYGRWTATHENYDASWEGEEDGYVSNGLMCEGRTIEDLVSEVEEKEAEMAAQGTEAQRAETSSGSVHDGPVGNADAPNIEGFSRHAR